MSASAAVLKPGATIGILGGGQLGRMLALAAARLGFKCHIFAPNPESPAFDVVHRVTCADYTDTRALDAFAHGRPRLPPEMDAGSVGVEGAPADVAGALRPVAGPSGRAHSRRRERDGGGADVQGPRGATGLDGRVEKLVDHLLGPGPE